MLKLKKVLARITRSALSFGKTINGIANAFAKVKAKVEAGIASFFGSMNAVRAIA